MNNKKTTKPSIELYSYAEPAKFSIRTKLGHLVWCETNYEIYNKFLSKSEYNLEAALKAIFVANEFKKTKELNTLRLILHVSFSDDRFNEKLYELAKKYDLDLVVVFDEVFREKNSSIFTSLHGWSDWKYSLDLIGLTY